MYLPRRPTVVGFMCSAVALAIVVAPKPAVGQSTQAKKPPVTVANTAANPVPVTVTDSVLPVEIYNADPIPVTVAPSATRTPIHANGTCDMGSLVTFCNALSYTVPGDKLLVIEMISLEAHVWGSQRPVSFIVTPEGSSVRRTVFLPMEGPPTTVGVLDVFDALHLVRFYADPGTTFSVQTARRGNLDGPATAEATITGYLVDCSTGIPCSLP